MLNYSPVRAPAPDGEGSTQIRKGVGYDASLREPLRRRRILFRRAVPRSVLDSSPSSVRSFSVLAACTWVPYVRTSVYN